MKPHENEIKLVRIGETGIPIPTHMFNKLVDEILPDPDARLKAEAMQCQVQRQMKALQEEHASAS